MAPAFTLNGRRIELERVDPHQTLLELLRERGLTGTKEGCAEGECGACAVALVRRGVGGTTEYLPVNSCLLLVGSVLGQELVTVEGLAQGGELHPVQRALVESGGSQCGYCTPGFAISLFSEYYRRDRNGFDPEAIAGNLCRCTGYRPIRDAARGLGRPEADDPFQRRLASPAPELASVRLDRSAPGFFRPTSLAEVFELWARHPAATLIAGGTDLVVERNQRHRRFDTLLSLENVAELHGVRWEDDALSIGAAVPLSDVERQVEGKLPMVEQLLRVFSSRLVRNRATFGGNLGTASPIGDGPPALLALDAEVELASATGTRRVALDQFFQGYRKTALGPAEVLVRVLIPRPLPDRMAFYKVSKRVLDDISTVAGAFGLRLDRDGKIRAARLAYGGVAATPARALEAEQALVGEIWSLESVRKAQAVLARSFRPLTDHRGSADYRASMVVRLLEKFFVETEARSP